MGGGVKRSEADMAAIVVRWFTEQRYDIYQEVQVKGVRAYCRYRGRDAAGDMGDRMQDKSVPGSDRPGPAMEGESSLRGGGGPARTGHSWPHGRQTVPDDGKYRARYSSRRFVFS